MTTVPRPEPVDPTRAETVNRRGLGQLTELAFDGVIFDLDGTLVDSTPAVIRSWTTWAAEFGVRASDLLRHQGMPSAGVVSAVLPVDRHEEASARITELELADVGDVVVLPGAAEALAAVASARSAIATSCTDDLATARIRAARLAPPSVLVTADQIARGKPAPDPFLEAAARLGVDPERCLVIEDAPAGLTAARAAGCRSLAVVTTHTADQLDADGVVDSLADVVFRVDDQHRIRVRAAERVA